MSSGFSTLKSLLSAAPQHLVDSSSSKPLDDSGGGAKQLNLKQKKKAAFEDWHKRKLDELQRKCSFDSDSSSVDTRTAVTPDSSTLPISDSLKLPTTSNAAQSESTIQHLLATAARIPFDTQVKALFPNPLTVHKIPSPPLSNKDLTSPKLSRHNDAAFYPNIQCILCNEWVCSRNRYMHIESHLQYRPYKCSVCNYDNRKKIFIELHINRVHKGASTVVYQPDPELEKRAWIMAEQCLQHTRQVLLNADSATKDKAGDASKTEHKKVKQSASAPSMLDKSLLAPYEDVFRPKIFNSQRNEKSLLIEESRHLGLIPDFSEVANREECCQLCRSFILRNPTLLEEHVRTHMSSPTYSCTFDECNVQHCSRNFLFRHMKEVHKTRKNVEDLMEGNQKLLDEFLILCRFCFPSFFTQDSYGHTSESFKRKNADIHHNQTKKAKMETSCLGCMAGFTLVMDEKKCVECAHKESKPKGRLICAKCNEFVRGDFAEVQLHALKHCGQKPVSCLICSYSDISVDSMKRHISTKHADKLAGSNNEMKKFVNFFNSTPFDWRSMWRKTCAECFDGSLTCQSESNVVRFLQGSICSFCAENVEGGLSSMFEHISKHFTDGQFGCLFCTYESNKHHSVEYHMKQNHSTLFVAVRQDISDECGKERDRIFNLCFPNYKSNVDSDPSAVVSSSTEGSTVLCKLCHEYLPSGDEEYLSHIKKHVDSSVFQCHFCYYKDVDVDRMKLHGQRLHNKSLYSKLTLDNELSLKYSQLMTFCFA